MKKILILAVALVFTIVSIFGCFNAFADTAVTVGLWNYIQLKNILDSDKLVVSFDMYNDAGEKLSFALMNKEHTASSSEWAVLLSMRVENNGGEIKFNGT